MVPLPPYYFEVIVIDRVVGLIYPLGPTNTIKNKLINILKRVKSQTGLSNQTYKSMYPTGCVPPKFYGLPRIHKPDTPLRPTVSSCGLVINGVAKEPVKILKPLVGKSSTASTVPKTLWNRSDTPL